MRLLYELSWLWEMIGIAMAAAVVCVACAALICKAAKKKLSRKVIAVVAAAAFAGAVLAVILIARTLIRFKIKLTPFSREMCYTISTAVTKEKGGEKYYEQGDYSEP